MKYAVSYTIFFTPEEIKATLEDMQRMEEELEIDPARRKVWTEKDITSPSRSEFWATDKEDLDRQLLEMQITPDQIVAIEVLIDDSQQVMRDTTLLSLAATEPCCAHYDWTSENVISFGRKVIAQYLKEQAELQKTS